MCSISGVLVPTKQCVLGNREVVRNLVSLVKKAEDRGRDSWGIVCCTASSKLISLRELGRASEGLNEGKLESSFSWAINNNRAEPTTEFVREKSLQDIQPFEYEGWVVAHNGTIANDKQLYKDFEMSPRTRIDSDIIPRILHKRFGDSFHPEQVIHFLEEQLVGSYALAIGHKDYPTSIVLLCNYKPLYLALNKKHGHILFTSLENYLREDSLEKTMYGEYVISQVKPYTGVILDALDYDIAIKEVPFKKKDSKSRALIVCSGGLDSTVTAAWAQQQGYDIALLHFLYSCRAESKEQEAVKAIGARLNCPVVFIETDIFKNTIGGSRLTGTLEEKVSEGEAGAEFAHEWVPARNLIMLSIATGYAESKGYEVLMLGNNLEESGAYPDNEMIFISKLNEVLPYATQVGKHVRIEMPVGNLMKHEIIKLGVDINAPLDLCWSCYEAGDIHCGNCGPCFMRKTGFEINGLVDMLPYATDKNQSND